MNSDRPVPRCDQCVQVDYEVGGYGGRLLTQPDFGCVQWEPTVDSTTRSAAAKRITAYSWIARVSIHATRFTFTPEEKIRETLIAVFDAMAPEAAHQGIDRVAFAALVEFIDDRGGS